MAVANTTAARMQQYAPLVPGICPSSCVHLLCMAVPVRVALRRQPQSMWPMLLLLHLLVQVMIAQAMAIPQHPRLISQCLICPCTCYCAGGEYYNYSGCGNTLNCNQPVVRQFILDCLKYWVQVGVGMCDLQWWCGSLHTCAAPLHCHSLSTILNHLPSLLTSLTTILYTRTPFTHPVCLPPSPSPCSHLPLPWPRPTGIPRRRLPLRPGVHPDPRTQRVAPSSTPRIRDRRNRGRRCYRDRPRRGVPQRGSGWGSGFSGDVAWSLWSGCGAWRYGGPGGDRARRLAY